MICYYFGIISVESFFAVLIIYPISVPFLSEFIFNPDVYVLRGMEHQTPGIGEYSTTIGLIFILTYYTTIKHKSLEFSLEYSGTKLSDYTFSQKWVIILPLSILLLMMAYLTTPGPTILTISYTEVIDNYYSWANFAGAMYVGTWILLYLILRRGSITSVQYITLLILTGLTVGWLLLHSRRNESLGILAVLVLDLTRQYGGLRQMIKTRSGIITAISAACGGLSFVLVEIVRSGGQFGYHFVQSSGGTTAMELPGGAHNIYGTFQVTLSIFKNEKEYLLGESFLWYLIQSIPTGILNLFGVTPPDFYFELLRTAYPTYLGGNFALNIYYANFGIIGIIFAACFLGWLARSTGAVLSKNTSSFQTGFAAVIVASAPRALWYTQIAWADMLQGFVAALIVYLNLCLLTTTNPISMDSRE
jgi:hypothetical protein